MMNEIKMIPIGDLEHHPENPRLDIGDIEELTASIKANGILQNLTVVPDLEKCKYLVVIGNRRLEAAKAAGLVELPCSIRDMDHQEQIATMLQENMQRTDLTVYEQAKGIQMMMDLGFSRDEISQRTGFSRSTIDRRLAVATLPEEETKEAVECGWDLTDLVEISKIEDPEKQKKLLTDTSPGNLKQAIDIAKRDQTRNRIKARLMPEIEKIAKKLKNDSDRWSSKYSQIRGMTVGDIQWKNLGRIIAREAATGVLLGSALGLLGLARAWMIGTGYGVAVTVGLGVLLVVLIGNLAGTALPLLARALHIDPAIMSGPFITTVVDIVGLIVYFETAGAVLGLSSANL